MLAEGMHTNMSQGFELGWDTEERWLVYGVHRLGCLAANELGSASVLEPLGSWRNLERFEAALVLYCRVLCPTGLCITAKILFSQ